MAEFTTISPASAKWLWGGQCCQFSASVRLGRGGVHDLAVERSPDEIRGDAAALRARPPGEIHHDYLCAIRRGRGEQRIPVRVPREMLLGIADALAGAVDAEDAGHRFWHWDRGSTAAPRPCPDCRETRDAELERARAARAAFVEEWAGRLDAEVAEVEELLAGYQALRDPADEGR